MATVLAPRQQLPHDDRVFLSVFPKIDFTTPTPEATPQIGSIPSPIHSRAEVHAWSDATNPAVELSRAWSVATRYLSLSSRTENEPSTVNGNVAQAFMLLLRSADTQNDLSSWYEHDLTEHFRSHVLPSLQQWQQPIPRTYASELLENTIRILESAQTYYLNHLKAVLSHLQQGKLEDGANAVLLRAQKSLHTAILHSLPRQRLQKTLASIMFDQLVSSLDQKSNAERCHKGAGCVCRINLHGLPLARLSAVGLGGLHGERAFAHAVHKFLLGPAIERRCFEVDWTGHTSVVRKLEFWIETCVCPVIEQALSALTASPHFKLAWNDRLQFASMAVSNLGRLRSLSLFDYIKSWPASTGAILDIWECLGMGKQHEKAQVCQSFSTQTQQRLLHAGASTSEILSIYVNTIHAFKALDSRGVLLEKVAVPLRNYLRAREDTVSIIATSFLANVETDGTVASTDDKICPDITLEVANSTLEEKRDNKMLNWDDMSWVPDPIDAGPDYKSSKSEDVIANILALFDQEEFIREVTNVLAQHLLRGSDPEFVKETRLIELFKSRLDTSKLQAAEVMLKDVRDSVSLGKRINPHIVRNAASNIPTAREIQAAISEGGITLGSLWQIFEGRMKRAHFVAAVKIVANKRNDLFYAKRTRVPAQPSQHVDQQTGSGTVFAAQILSSFFWPQLRSDDFAMPAALQGYPTSFEERFYALGSQRKLKFQPALARINLRLDLEDRTIEERDVSGWRASVIDAFSSEGSLHDNRQGQDVPVNLTVEQLMQTLSMEEQLIQDALNFWTNKSVLYQPSPGVYAVLERLDMDTGLPPSTLPQPEETISAVMSQDAMLQEGAPMFETFIANMLRNQGPKQIGGMMGITGLLKMVLPTFTYGDDEVAWLLGEMERRGEVVRNGDVWAVVS